MLMPMLKEADPKVTAEALSDMDAEITALEQKRDTTKLIKQGMMQDLLTNKVRGKVYQDEKVMANA